LLEEGWIEGIGEDQLFAAGGKYGDAEQKEEKKPRI
jgi:hypothetical protein